MKIKKTMDSDKEKLNTDEGYNKLRTLCRIEHMHLQPQLYLGRIGDGSSIHDGIYTLIRKIIESRLEEFRMKLLDTFEVHTYTDNVKRVTIQYNGKEKDLVRLIEDINYSNSIDYNNHISNENDFWFGVVNGMSKYFEIQRFQNGFVRKVVTEYGKIVSNTIFPTQKGNGTYVSFEPDETIFGNFKYDSHLTYEVLDNYSYVTPGLTIKYNDAWICAPYGLADLIGYTIFYSFDALYPIIHFVEENIEVAFTHIHNLSLVKEGSSFLKRYRTLSPNEYYDKSSIFLSFVNGTITELGGIHQESLKTSIVKTIRDFFGRNFNSNDILNGIVAAISIWVKDPLFEDSGRYRLGGTNFSTDGKCIKQSVGDFIEHKLNDYLATHSEVAISIKHIIELAEHNRE